ncbi:MAG: polyprenyl synthetase family protein, partial [Desulfobaccales bacterium]
KITEAEYFEVITRKTAILMASACQIGAILAGAPPAQEEALARLGLHLGITFQMVDDLLDFTGDQGEIGKEVGADLREGRVTLPLIHALAQAGPQDRQRLQELAQGLTPEMAPELRRLLDRYGSLDHCRSLARQHTLEAQGDLEIFGPCLESTYFRLITEELLARTH